MNENEKLVYEYWLDQSPPWDPILKPTFKPIVAAAITGCQKAEYGLEWPIHSDDEEIFGAMKWDIQARQTILDQIGVDVKDARLLDQQRALWYTLRTFQPTCLMGILAAQRQENEEDIVRGVVAAFVDHYGFADHAVRDKDVWFNAVMEMTRATVSGQ